MTAAAQVQTFGTAVEGAVSPAYRFLTLYLLSQSFLIPIAALGPVWALWPTLSDIAWAGLAFSALSGSRSRAVVTPAQRSLLHSLLLIWVLCLVSYLMGLLVIGLPASGKSLVMIDGAYDLFRLAQFILLFWAVIQIPLDPQRLRMLGLAMDFAFLAVCTGIFLTYFEVIPLGLLTSHLPADPHVSGNWSRYALSVGDTGEGKGLGTVSYSHAYGAVQILMLLALRLHLLQGRYSLLAAAYVLIGVAGTVLTESRAGLAAILLFAGVFSLRNPKILIGAIVLATLSAPFIDPRRIERTLQRQQTITEATGDDNLSGRPLIWAAHMKSLTDSPLDILIGGGIGSSRVNGQGSSAHMLYLQVLSECGVVGLLIFGLLMGSILQRLFVYDIQQRPLFWATVALLLSAVTQETFYPQPSGGHFIGFFLLAVAVGLRPVSTAMRDA